MGLHELIICYTTLPFCDDVTCFLLPILVYVNLQFQMQLSILHNPSYVDLTQSE